MTKSTYTRWSLLVISLTVSIFFSWVSTSLLAASSTPRMVSDSVKFINTAVSPTNTLPISLSKQLTTGVPGSVDQFGTLLAIDGDTIAVSAYATDTVYVYERNYGGIENWGEVAQLTASDGQDDIWEWFGIPVALLGNYLVVGAPFATVDGKSYQGAAYVFEHTENQGTSQWLEVAKLTASDGLPGDAFGFSLDIDGETIVVGNTSSTPPDILPDTNPGKVYVFQQQTGTDNWLETAILTTTNGYGDESFGTSVAISNDTIVVGADITQKAYLFRFNPNQNQWNELTELIPIPLLDGIGFAVAVEIEGSTVLVGHTGANVNGNTSQGAVYLFEQSATNPDEWPYITTLTAADGAAQAEFGIDIALANKTVLIGAHGDNAAYLFHQNAGGAHTWGQTNKITSPDNNREFGLGVAIMTNTIAIGDRQVVVGNNEERGITYIYSLTTTFPLTIQFDGNGGGQVMGNILENVCTDHCVESIEYGTAVTLTAVPDVNSMFAGWSGSCISQALVCHLVMQTDITVFARFEAIEYKQYLPIVVR